MKSVLLSPFTLWMLRHREVKDLSHIPQLTNGRAEIQTQGGLASKLVGVEVGVGKLPHDQFNKSKLVDLLNR